MKRHIKIGLITGILLCLLGVAGVAPTLYFKLSERSTVSAQPAFETPKKTETPASTTAKPVTSGHPVSVSVPSVGINNVSVVDGAFNEKTKQWTLGLHTAHWGIMTPQPNDTSGNTFIYGHYRPEVFAYLHHAKPGAEAIVTTDNGYKFIYTLQEVVDVGPNDTSLFGYEGPSMLTLQTCSGSWFQNRQLFKFTFTRVEQL